MQRILLVYNPRSSQYVHVKEDIFPNLSKLKGYQVGKFLVKKASLEENIAALAKIIKNGDLIISAGGDATSAVAANAVLKSNKNATYAALPYGNFNDLARTLGTTTFNDIIENYQNPADFYPLAVYVDGKFWRYAFCYATIGMTAEAITIFDHPEIRAKMREGHKSSWRSYCQLISWYMKNRHKRLFLSKFTLNGVEQPPKTSDYVAMNGASMARVMKGGEDYMSPTTFKHETGRTVKFWCLFKIMWRSITSRVPGSDTTGDLLEFLEPSTVMIQAEGEGATFNHAHKIEIKKGQKCLKIVKKH